MRAEKRLGDTKMGVDISQKSQIIAVTGTKGKTSVVRALHHAVQSALRRDVLSVDTHRIYIGDRKIMSANDSMRLFGVGSTVCPGKFLYALYGQSEPVAILEASLGSNRAAGLGYWSHQVGVFTNVYDDHIGRDYLQTREQLAEEKAFIFRQIRKNGFAVYGADNDLVVKQLSAIRPDRSIRTIACTLSSKANPSADFVAKVEGDKIVILEKTKRLAAIDIADHSWILGGKHQPTLYNALFIFAALFTFFFDDRNLFDRAVDALKSYWPDERGGRMVIKTASNGAKIILDFAHEYQSLTNVADFARTLVSGKGRVIGVVRMTGTRPDEHILSTAAKFVSHYDELFIYEKENDDDSPSERKPGDAPQLIKRAADNLGVPATVVLDKQEALKAAYDVSTANDVIIYIIHSSTDSYEVADSVFKFRKEDGK
ncbi:MAG: hypothetical protein LBK50_00015 [Candidatus Nomurabacteria bacterium]|jgi:UDP-N-acetylmuramyl tripeptide synthase|nr:hypothetical protein [Candidatus Nomurabacteria bacterium]